ncbi:predicted protein [Naegleria gruberi]|uniref:Predicted protein n=1 Tax=Naegleria gruberi TaxID=5762 RepID=D2VLB8_NAEGR|nr:uncharacterized protein NAEGRDRAFT_69724 [Naegleria gruberi]EFC42282.1 predicted protein [Naegleria gruberi]|eukprot:XP_002675026.1 predicted protein [Naegleria gruberi strain NEG-M]
MKHFKSCFSSSFKTLSQHQSNNNNNVVVLLNNSQGFIKRNIYQRPQPKLTLFDRNQVRKHKEYSLKCTDGKEGEYDYVKAIIANSIVDRLSYFSKSLKSVCEIGCGKGFLIDRLLNKTIIDFLPPDERKTALEQAKKNKSSIGETELNYPVLHFQGIENYTLCDQSQLHLDAIQIPSDLGLIKGNTIKNITKVHLDEDGASLPFEDNSLDCVVAGFYLHWVNDLPGFLKEVERVLKPDGAFVGALLGGNTLSELRTSFVLSEQEREGGVSPHVSPLSSIEDAGNVLTRAGFKLPTIDAETIKVYYPDPFTLMHHLQGMGENNALFKRRTVISRQTLIGAAAIYDHMFRENDRGVPATFEVIHMIGWKHDESQPKPAKRGSGTLSMKDFAKEIGTQLHVAVDDESNPGSSCSTK